MPGAGGSHAFEAASRRNGSRPRGASGYGEPPTKTRARNSLQRVRCLTGSCIRIRRHGPARRGANRRDSRSCRENLQRGMASTGTESGYSNQPNRALGNPAGVDVGSTGVFDNIINNPSRQSYTVLPPAVNSGPPPPRAGNGPSGPARRALATPPAPARSSGRSAMI